MLGPSFRKERRLKKRADEKQLQYRQLHVKKGDLVRVLSGKDRGKEGRVLEVVAEKDRVLVEKVNIVKRHQKPTQKIQKGGIIEKENYIHASNVALVCPHCKEQMRPKRISQDGVKTRACRECNEPLDLK
jgi:large subunit ribosomal protein L24